MKHFIIIFLCGLALGAEAQYISYTYDAAGNRTKRELVMGTFRKAADTSAVSDYLGAEKFSIAPNPTTGVVRVEMANKELEEEREYSLLNLSGLLITTKTSKDPSQSFDLSGQPAGIYLIRIRQKDEEVVWRIVKE